MCVPRHRRLPIIVLAVLAAWPLLGASPAAADTAAIRAKRAQVERLAEQLAGLDQRMDVAAEELRRSRDRLGLVVERMRRNRVTLVRVTRDLHRSRDVLAERLVNLYRRPRPSLVAILVQDGGVTGAVEEIGALDRAGRQDAEIVGGIRVRRATVVDLRRQLARDRQEARAEAARAERRRADVEGLVARQREVLAGAESDLQQLIAEERERRRREAERRRREAEARRRAEEERRQALARQQASTAAAPSPVGAASWTTVAPSGGTAYPLATAGPVVGTPYTGTHTLGNWQSDRALDIVIPVGTPVLAVASGVIGSTGGGGSGRFAGLNLHLNAAADSYFYAHLSSLTVSGGQSVTRGQVIGYSGEANGVAHLHIACESCDPMGLAAGN